MRVGWLLALAALSSHLFAGAAAAEGALEEGGRLDHAALYELGKTRTNECKACQRMVMHLDEQLLPYIMDVQGELKRGRRPKYGQFEEIIENTLPKACKAPSIYMERKVRKACENILEHHADMLVRAYYRWSKTAEDEINMNNEVCGKVSRSCPPDLARIEAEDLEMLEHPPVDPNTPPKYRSQPAPEGPPVAGEVHQLVALTFIRQVVTEGAGRDALVHFSFPGSDKALTEQLRAVMKMVAQLLSGADPAKSLIVGELDTEANEIPHPYNSNVKGPSVMIFPAGKKQNPSLLWHQDAGASKGYEVDSAPTVADLLSFVYRRAGVEQSKEVAGEAVVHADKDTLYSQGKRAAHDEL